MQASTMWTVFVLFAVVAAANAQTQVSQCIRNPGELPLNVDVVGCVTPPCLLPQLKYVKINMIFRTPRTVRSLRTLANAYISLGPFTMDVPHDLGDNALTCNFFTNSYCPVLEGEVLTYQLMMFIEPTFPVGTQATIEFRIVDETDNNSALACIRLPIRVLSPLSALEGPKGRTQSGV